MKTKNFLFAIAALLCVMVMNVTMSSCSKDDDEDQWVSYSVNPSGSFDPLNTNCLDICGQMRTALDKGMNYTNSVCKRDDAKAKSICDKVYQETKNSAIGSFAISLSVAYPSSNPGADNSTVVATYNY